MARSLVRILNLRPGDAARGLPLCAFLFLTIAGYVVGQVARDALFLGRFPARLLPYADLANVLGVVLVVSVVIRLGRRSGLGTLIWCSLLFFAAGGLLFWIVAISGPAAWLPVAVYLWVGAFGALAPAQVWTLAGWVLDPREAKRLFGLLGAGATLGGAFGGVLSHAAARRWGAESLLLLAALMLAVSALLAAVIWRRARPALRAQRSWSSETPRTLTQSLERIRGSQYLRVIAGLIGLSSFVTSLAGWQLKAMAQEAFVRQDALAAFLGAFNACVGAATLVAQALVSSRLLIHAGLGAALLVLPAVLLAGSLGVLLWGSLAAVVALKGGEKLFRYSLERPAVELLYLPLSPAVKVQVKSFIDIVVWRMGDGLAGLTVLAAATWAGAGPRALSAVSLAAVAGWFALAMLARQRYVEQLRDSIQQHRLDAERASVQTFDRATTELLASRLVGGETGEVLYALSLLAAGGRQAAHPAVRGLLAHPAAEVRRAAIGVLDSAGDRGSRAAVEALLMDPDIDVRTEALLFLAHHFKVDPVARLEELHHVAGFSVQAAMASYLAHAGESQNLEASRLLLEAMVREPGESGARARVEAARALGSLPDGFHDLIEALLRDSDEEVARAALDAAARTADPRLAPAMLERLGDLRLETPVAEAVAGLGDAALPALERSLGDAALPETRLRVPGVLARIGSEAAAQALMRHLLDPNGQLRLAVLAALNKLRREQPDVVLDPLALEAILAAEIVGHYRSYQIQARLRREGDRDDPLLRGLREAMAQELERVFRILELRFPENDLHSVYLGLVAGDPVVRGHALDLLDQVLKPSLRRLLLPLVDGDVGADERAAIGERIVGAGVANREEALEALLGCQDPWLRSCAVYAIGALGMRELARSLEPLADDPDPLLREAVRQARARLGASGPASTPESATG